MNEMTSRRVVYGSAALMLAGVIWRWAGAPGVGHAAPLTWGQLAQLVVPLVVLIAAHRQARHEIAHRVGNDAARADWSRWAAMMVVPYSAVCLALYGYNLLSSLGMTDGLSGPAVQRAVYAACALLCIVLGNLIPKLPPMPLSFGLARDLTPVQMAPLLRLRGRLMVALGVAILLCDWLWPPFTGLVLGGGLVWVTLIMVRQIRRLKARIPA